MKIKQLILTAVSLLLACSMQAGQGYTQFSTGGVQYNASGLTNYAVITTESKNGGDPVIAYINATSDKGGSAVQFYYVLSKAQVVATPAGQTASSTVYFVNLTNVFNVGDPVVMEHLGATNTVDAANLYELGFITGLGVVSSNVITGGGATGTYTNYIYAMTNAVAGTYTNGVGDIVYDMTLTNVGNIPVGVGTLSLAGYQGVYSGQRNKPLLMILKGGTNATINAVSANFVP